MVEINDIIAFLDMLAWSEGTDNGRQKTRNQYGRHCRRRAIIDYSDHPRKLVTLNQNSTTGAGRYQLLSCWDITMQWPGDFSEKSGRCGIVCRLRSVALYL